MVKGDDRLDVALAQSIDDLFIVVYLFSAELLLYRLDTAPLKREPVSVVAQALRLVEIILKENVGIGRSAAAERHPAVFLPEKPIILFIGSFDLI